MKAITGMLLASGLLAGLAFADDAVVSRDGGTRAADLAPRGLQPAGSASKLVVNVVTEVTAAGHAAPQGDRDHPVLCQAHDGGSATVGDVIGGEREPARAVLIGALKTALAANGYVLAGPAERPAVLIFYRWGSFNREPRGFPDLERVNLVERAALVGGTDFGLEVAREMNGGMLEVFSHKDPRTELLMDQARSNLYFLIASAYDYPAAKRGERLLLWRTKLSTQSRGVTMDEALLSAVAEAVPYFGRATTGSIRVEGRLREGRVEVGEPVVKDYLAVPLPSGFAPDSTDLKPIPASKILGFPSGR